MDLFDPDFSALTRKHLQVAVRTLGVNPNGMPGYTLWAAVASRAELEMALAGVERDWYDRKPCRCKVCRRAKAVEELGLTF